jgi:hypothetical protein
MPRQLFVLLTLALAACGDPAVGLDGTRLDGPPYLRATIDGEPWAAEVIRADDGFGRGAAQRPDGGVELTLSGVGYAQSPRSRQLHLHVTRATLGVPVPIDHITAFMIVSTSVVPSGDTNRVELALSGPDAVGSITLTAYDPIQRRLSGRFDFRAPITVQTFTPDSMTIVASDSIIAVSDGVFLVDLAP